MLNEILKLNPINLNCSIFSVYDYDSLSIQELLCQFFTKINELVTSQNKVINLTEWLVNQGLSEELSKQLNQWLIDGTLENIINKDIFRDLNNKINSAMEQTNLNSNELENLKPKIEKNIRDIETNSDDIIEIKSTIQNNENKINVLENNDTTINNEIDTIKNTLNKQKFVVVYLNEYAEIAKEGTLGEDWSKAFKYVFDNVVNDSVATIKWNGRLKIKSTINLPRHVNLEGTGLPWSGLTPSSDFVGEYVITDLNTPTHNSLKNIYFDFAHNKRVKGIKVENPYDYNEYKMLVADGIGDCFLNIGGSKISQSTRIQDCVIYRENMGDGAIVELRNCQEFYLTNNKFLYKNQGNHECVWCDGVTNTTFIHNSFAFTNETALKLLAYNFPKKLDGNLIIGNLFEGIGEKGCINIIGSAEHGLEGSYNSIEHNSYFSSNPKITLGNISNTYICDPVQIQQMGGDKRTYFFNKYNLNSSQTSGNVEEWTDGAYKITKSWFEIKNVAEGEPSYFYMYDSNGKRHQITVGTDGNFQIQ